MSTKTFKKPLEYYKQLYTNELLIDEMNKIKPVSDPEEKSIDLKTKTICNKIIKAFQLISLGLSLFVFGCSVALLIKYLLL